MIVEQINTDLIATMKDREPARKEQNEQKIMTLRTLMAEIKTFKMNNKRDPDDAEVSGIITKAIKQFRETLETAGTARPDVAEREKAKIALLEKYLPPQMSREEIEAVVVEAIAESGAQSTKDMGKVMGLVRPKTQGKADGKVVSEVVKEKLSALGT